MPMSEAAIEGIGKHGLGWKHRIDLGPGVKELGKFNDAHADDEEIDYDEVGKSALKIVKVLKDLHQSHDWARELDFKGLADDLEMVADETMDDINDAMGRIYDVCDYNRILVSNQ